MGLKVEVNYSVKTNGKNSPQYDLTNDLNANATIDELFQFTKLSLIKISKDALKEELDKGFDKSYTTIVDNKFNAPIEAVNPFGKIEFVARSEAKEIITFIWEGINRRSPVDTGRYISSHVVTYNGTQVAYDRSTLDAWLATNPSFTNQDKIRFINFQPYARKLERLGVTRQGRNEKRRPEGRNKTVTPTSFVSVPSGAYALTYRIARAKYRRNSFIAFDFLPATSIGASGSFVRAATRGRSRGRGIGRPYLFPSILFYVVEKGII